MLMLMQIRTFLVGFIASEEGVKTQAILPVAWVAAVMMVGAVVLNMPDKAPGQHLLLGGLVPQHEPSYQLQLCV